MAAGTKNIFLNKEQIHTLQEEKLAETLRYVQDHSVYYQHLFQQHKIEISGLNRSNFNRIPFTTKDDLAQHNDHFLCVPKSKVADFVTTSGTLSDPVTFYLTDLDIDRLASNEAQALQCAGGSDQDIYQLMTTIDKQFMAGLAYYQGIRKMNAGVIRIGPGTPYAQWESIKRFSPTVLIAIPSFIPMLLKYANEHGIDYRSTQVKSIVCIGEPIRNPDFSLNELGKRIQSQWDVQLFSTYASTEMGAAFTECEAGLGGHLNPELLILEVVDENGKEVLDDELGEVVVTTLGVEGMPLLRYKTGDLCHVHYSPCTCGRHTARLGPVVGRKQQMIKFKGTTIFPPAIFNVLEMVKEIEIFQVEIAKNEYGNDDIFVVLSDELQNHDFELTLISLFKSRLRVTPGFKYIDKLTLNARVFKQDKRKSEKIIYI